MGDAEDVRIDGDGMFAERGVEHDVRRLATDARQRFERFAIPWYFAAVQVQYLSTQADDVLRLGLIQADGLDVFAQRSEEHTSELQSLMRIAYAVLRL